MESPRIMQQAMSRRTFGRGALALGLGAAGLPALLSACGGGGSGEGKLAVLAPAAPDPTPVGVADFGSAAEASFTKWQSEHQVEVAYEALPWPQLHDRIATTFASGSAGPDVLYMGGWIPEFSDHLVNLSDLMPAEIVSNMPKSAIESTTWHGENKGMIFTNSVLSLYYNTEHFAEAGLSGPPANWQQFKEYATELNNGKHYGFVLNYGDPVGVGGTASYWMVFLQQAGGTMYGADGTPAFNTPEGVDALQFMIDLQKAGGDPASISYVGINDAAAVFLSGKASMMWNWPLTYSQAQKADQSSIVGKVGAAVLPAGAAGTASLDGADAWSVAATAKDQELAAQLIQYYLSPEQQKAQVLQTGWLPILTSVMSDPEVQKAAPNAKAILEQRQSPCNSFLTPDYTQVTQAIGSEVQAALQGDKTAAQAIGDADKSVRAIVASRS
ncbi:extracellular solute-binding protein [Mycolicibacterium mengxianglii]|uniref:extracellular solute-binding protein n=1 Tax=Mycolicibacterium mengxianglii TaxID=2736649 RepID=UPI0018EF1D47|nr:extracellular solute-binding protein [Mycolicibacterium mengxianglii]